MDNELRAAADLLVAGIETAHKVANADIILIVLGPKYGQSHDAKGSVCDGG